MSKWTIEDTETGETWEKDSRADAEAAVEMFGDERELEIVPPTETDGGAKKATVEDTPDEDPREGTPEPVDVDPDEFDLPDRSVSDNPLNWVPGDFVDEIDGSQAINRMGFEVLGHFYNVDVEADLEVPPEETDFEFCRVKAVATTPDGRTCEAFGSAHVDRGDDSYLLLEMADTRARKRALSIATGVGAVAVAELRSEVDA